MITTGSVRGNAARRKPGIRAASRLRGFRSPDRNWRKSDGGHARCRAPCRRRWARGARAGRTPRRQWSAGRRQTVHPLSIASRCPGSKRMAKRGAPSNRPRNSGALAPSARAWSGFEQRLQPVTEPACGHELAAEQIGPRMSLSQQRFRVAAPVRGTLEGVADIAEGRPGAKIGKRGRHGGRLRRSEGSATLACAREAGKDPRPGRLVLQAERDP